MSKNTIKDTLELAKKAISALVVPMEALNIVYGDQYAPETIKGIKTARKLAQEALPAIEELLGALVSRASPPQEGEEKSLGKFMTDIGTPCEAIELGPRFGFKVLPNGSYKGAVFYLHSDAAEILQEALEMYFGQTN